VKQNIKRSFIEQKNQVFRFARIFPSSFPHILNTNNKTAVQPKFRLKEKKRKEKKKVVSRKSRYLKRKIT